MQKIMQIWLKAQTWVFGTKIGREALKVGADGAMEDVKKLWRKIFGKKVEPKPEIKKTGNTFINLIDIAMLKNLKDWKTTVTGVVMVIIFGLSSFGLISPDEGAEIKGGLQTIIDSLGGGVVGIIGTAASALGAILLMFAKDPKKNDNK